MKTTIAPTRFHGEQNPDSFVPGKIIKGTVLQILDSYHYLLQVKNRKMVAFSELILQPGQTIQAKIKGTFPNLLMQVLVPETGIPLTGDLPTLAAHATGSDMWLMTQINKIVNSLGSADEKIVQSLFTFFKISAPWARFLNRFQQLVTQNSPDLLDRSVVDQLTQLQTRNEWPLHLLNALSFFQAGADPLPGDDPFYPVILEMMKTFRKFSTGKEFQQELSKLWDDSWNFFSGLSLYNHFPDSVSYYVPFVFYFDREWNQASFVFKKKKDGNPAYFSVILNLSQSGPVEALFYFIDKGQFNLKIRSKNPELMERIRLNQGDLKNHLTDAGILMGQLTLELEPPQWMPGMSPEHRKTRIDYQV